MNFWAAFAAYGVMAVIVLASRIIFPNRRKAQVQAEQTIEAPVAEAAPKSVPVMAEAA